MWQWIEHCEDEEHGTSEDDVQCGSLSTDSDLCESDSERNESSTVSFKCVGVTRDPSYQEALKTALKAIHEGKVVPVRVEPEPNNPFDSHAVSFQCKIGGQWSVFGYVIKELCDCVQDAVTRKDIISVKFAWIKYKVLRTSGPGYYTAINVTRRHTWSPIMHSLANMMYH